MKQIGQINLNSNEEDIIEFCNFEADQAPGYGHEMKLNYGLNVLLVKQQKKIIEDQTIYNSKQLFWTRILAIATIGLAIITTFLIKFN